MTPETLERHFDLLTDAPNAAKKLRELVLQLAVQGKLVEQDPSDEPAGVLLKEIEKEHKHLASVKKVKKTLPVRLVGDNERPFQAPNNWEWVFLDKITTNIHYGYTASADHNLSQVRMLRITDIQDSKVQWESVPGCEIEEEKVENYELKDGDLLIARTGGTIGKSYLVDNVSVTAVFASYLIRAIPTQPLSARYLKIFLDSPLYWKQLYAKSMGTGQPNVNATSLKALLVPLPPLEEQKRIVAKVDELMGLIDRLEAQGRAKRDARMRFGGAALGSLLSAEDADTFAGSWRRVRDNFDLLCAAPESVAELRKAVLQLAVQGKLVPQNPEDEPAGVLLERIKIEKAQLEKTGKIKKAKKLPVIDEGDVPFALPDSWEWVRIGNFYEVIGGIQKTPKRRPVNNAYPYLRVANVQRDRLELTEIEYFELFEGDLDKWKLEVGDILTVEGNGSEKEIGRCATWNGAIENCVHQNHLIRSRPIGHAGQDFTLLFLNSLAGTAEMKELAITTSGLYTLSVGKIEKIAVPLPPLNEQKRIVAKVDELMGLIDALEEGLKRAQGDAKRLLDAVVHRLLA